jgi:effector-binding domain-containing protein
MTAGFKIIDKDVEYTLEIEKNIAMWKMPQEIGQGYKAIIDYLKEKGTEPAGIPYVHYLGIDWGSIGRKNKIKSILQIFTRKWRLRIGFPVRERIEGNDYIVAGSIPAGRYIQALHRGPYEGLETTYGELRDWAKQQNLRIANETIERYLSNPQTVKKEDLETIVLVPILEQ